MVDATEKRNRNNDDGDEPMEEPPSAMLSLLEKYSRMDAQMTQVRQEITRIQLEIQTRNANAEKLVEERQEMIAETQRVTKESKILREDAQQAHRKLKAIQEEVQQSKHKKEETQRNLHRLERQSKEYRRRFFESSVSFRNECKKRKITCQKLGLIHEPLVAHAVVFRPELISSLDDADHQYETQSRKQVEERNHLQAQLKALEASHTASKRRRDALQKQKDNLLSRSRDRSRRKANLQAQLDRISKDIDSLQSRIQSETTSFPTRSQELPKANCPSRSTTARNNGVVGARSAIVRNPYAKSNQKKPQQPSSSSSSRRRQTMNPQKTNYNGSNNQISGATTTTTTRTTEQYPHRVAGRRRAPRDFGLSLRIQDGTDSSDDSSKDDDLLSFVAFRK